MKLLRFAYVCLSFIIFTNTTSVYSQTSSTSSSWYRNVVISPDGDNIVFTYSGQIWIVGVQGGNAIPLTSESVYSSSPVWSPNGKHLAYQSNKYGEGDVFVIDMDSYRSFRLTYHGHNDTPFSFSADGKHVLFQSRRIGNGDSQVNNGAEGRASRLYSVPVHGGRVQIILESAVSSYSLSSKGDQALYTDFPSYIEQEWRKGEQSDAARNIWKYDTKSGEHTQLTTFRGEDRNAVFSNDEKSMYFLSERSGSFNIWKQSLTATENKAIQVTHHEKLPVRFLSISNQGDLAYGFDGQIWLKKRSSKLAQKVNVNIIKVWSNNNVVNVNLNNEITEVSVSPTAPEAAVVARGEIFIISLLTGESRRLTNTPQVEKNISFSSDGATLLYSSEREGNWDLFSSHIGKMDTSFLLAHQIIEQQLTDSLLDEIQPLFSPDNRRIAYRESMNTLKVMSIDDSSIVTLIDRHDMYSHYESDWFYQWSPNGKYIVSRDGNRLASNNIVLLDSYGKDKAISLSYSGFSQYHPQFSDDGDLVYWYSDKHSLIKLNGESVHQDIYSVALNKDIHTKLNLSEDQTWFIPPEEGPHPDNAIINKDNVHERVQRLTPYSMNIMASYLSSSHKELMVVNDHRGEVQLIRFNLISGQNDILFAQYLNDVRGVTFTPDRSMLLLFGNGLLKKIDLDSGVNDTVSFSLDAELDLNKEKHYLFNHFWRLTKNKFYDKGLHGVNWNWYKSAYSKHLNSIHNYTDFAHLLSELAGELNASHTGAEHLVYHSHWDNPASLGIIYDDEYRGKGAKVREVLTGGPTDFLGDRLKNGSIILSVNDVEIQENQSIYPLLNNLEGKVTRLSVLPSKGDKKQIIEVKPVSLFYEAELSYQRWVREREAITSELSYGNLGYVHIREMNDDSYHELMNKLFGEYRDKEGVIIDVRYNSGGDLHDQLMSVLSGERRMNAISRDSDYIASFPTKRWAKPSIMLANASSYSDGSMVPYSYQKEGIGKLIGERIPGSGTFVHYSIIQEPSLIYLLPQLGVRDEKGQWLENQEVIPNTLVYNSPSVIEQDVDKQLEVAIRELLLTLN